MLEWAKGFLVIAAVAAIFGFTSLAGPAAGVAQVIFWIFASLWAVAALARVARGQPPAQR